MRFFFGLVDVSVNGVAFSIPGAGAAAVFALSGGGLYGAADFFGWVCVVAGRMFFEGSAVASEEDGSGLMWVGALSPAEGVAAAGVVRFVADLSASSPAFFLRLPALVIGGSSRRPASGSWLVDAVLLAPFPIALAVGLECLSLLRGWGSGSIPGTGVADSCWRPFSLTGLCWALSDMAAEGMQDLTG